MHIFFSFPSDFCAADDDFRNQFKVPPFQDCMLSFLGFSDDEKANMEEMTEMQGYCLWKLPVERMGFIADKYYTEAKMLDCESWSVSEGSSTWRAINWFLDVSVYLSSGSCWRIVTT